MTAQVKQLVDSEDKKEKKVYKGKREASIETSTEHMNKWFPDKGKK